MNFRMLSHATSFGTLNRHIIFLYIKSITYFSRMFVNAPASTQLEK